MEVMRFAQSITSTGYIRKYTCCIRSLIHSIVHLFIHLFTHSFDHSIVHSFIQLFIYSFIHLRTHSFIHPIIFSSCIHLFIHCFLCNVHMCSIYLYLPKFSVEFDDIYNLSDNFTTWFSELLELNGSFSVIPYESSLLLRPIQLISANLLFVKNIAKTTGIFFMLKFSKNTCLFAGVKSTERHKFLWSNNDIYDNLPSLYRIAFSAMVLLLSLRLLLNLKFVKLKVQNFKISRLKLWNVQG